VISFQKETAFAECNFGTLHRFDESGGAKLVHGSGGIVPLRAV